MVAKPTTGYQNVPKDDDPFSDLPGLTQACKSQLKALRVAVVGGGFAGLVAALRLSRHGVKVTVYEPHKQWGGRVRSSRTFADGRIIELGAELIGSFHTACLRLAQKYGIAMINRMGEVEYERERLSMKLRLSADKDLTWPEIKKLNEKVDKVLKAISTEASQIRQETCPWEETDPVLKIKLLGYDHSSLASQLEKTYGVVRDSPLWEMLKFRLVNDEVAQLEEMNYLGLLCKVAAGMRERFELDHLEPEMGYWEELEIFRCANGAQSLADRMVTEIKERGGTLVPRTAVTGIDIRAKEVQVTTEGVKWITDVKYDPGPKVKVSPMFQYVVLAIPPSVWGDVVVSYNGSQEELETKIGKMTKGEAVKFFSGMRDRFWITEETTKVRGFAPSGGTLELGQIWEGTDNQTQNGTQGTVLSVFAGPLRKKKNGEFGAPKQSEMQVELRKLYSGYDKNLIKTLYANWPEEPFIKMGYWSPKPDGEIFRLGPMLNAPYPDVGRLYFAGEHTYPSFFGYMEGALRSGIRAANMLMSAACGLTVYPCPPPSPAPSKVMVARAGQVSKSDGLG